MSGRSCPPCGDVPDSICCQQAVRSATSWHIIEAAIRQAGFKNNLRGFAVLGEPRRASAEGLEIEVAFPMPLATPLSNRSLRKRAASLPIDRRMIRKEIRTRLQLNYEYMPRPAEWLKQLAAAAVISRDDDVREAVCCVIRSRWTTAMVASDAMATLSLAGDWTWTSNRLGRCLRVCLKSKAESPLYWIWFSVMLAAQRDEWRVLEAVRFGLLEAVWPDQFTPSNQPRLPGVAWDDVIGGRSSIIEEHIDRLRADLHTLVADHRALSRPTVAEPLLFPEMEAPPERLSRVPRKLRFLARAVALFDLVDDLHEKRLIVPVPVGTPKLPSFV